MIDVWSDNAKELLESVDEWDIFDADLGDYGQVKICFDDDGCVVIHDSSNTNLDEEEINEIINFALGNIDESECFWAEESDVEIVDEPIDMIDFYERYSGV